VDQIVIIIKEAEARVVTGQFNADLFGNGTEALQHIVA
jgi:hypothetical protein